MANWMTSFGPGYDLTGPANDLARLGLADQSWHNDACPSFGGRGLVVWADHPDPESREFPESARWAVVKADDQGGPTDEYLLESESWQEVLDLVLAHVASAT